MLLSQYMRENRYTDERFARENGFNRQTIFKIRNFIAEPSLRTALTITKATGGRVGLTDLLRPDGYKKQEKQAERTLANQNA